MPSARLRSHVPATIRTFHGALPVMAMAGDRGRIIGRGMRPIGFLIATTACHTGARTTSTPVATGIARKVSVMSWYARPTGFG
ncbi:hypothetical protein D3C73_1434130 [compost metagenome]